MADQPLFDRIVIGWEDSERGDDAAALGEMLGAAGGGEVRRVHIESGPAGRGLQELAERGEADLIALGSTHRAAIGSVAPGSVAEHLLAGAPCIVAVAPRGYARARATLAAEAAGSDADDVPHGTPLPFVRDRPRVVAVGYNGTPEAGEALDRAVEIASATRSAMRIITVAESVPGLPAAATASAPPPGTTPGQRLTADMQSALHEAAAGLPAELRALPVFARGDAAEVLLDEADGSDLLVLGSRGFGPVMRVLLGSVSAKVIRRAPCPVLVVPRPASNESR
jgi:nucleotide-binding universal stress UspA family protein